MLTSVATATADKASSDGGDEAPPANGEEAEAAKLGTRSGGTTAMHDESGVLNRVPGGIRRRKPKCPAKSLM